MAERRYDEEETRRIFDAASRVRGRPEGSSEPPASGFTLAELQQIGAEAGIDPVGIAEAARALEARASVAVGTRRMAGLPIGVSRAVDLPTGFTDTDWNRLVVDLRETFDATGRIRVEGQFREWRNGNLRALVEPTGEGYRLRLRTMKGSAYSAITFGGVALAVSVLMLVAAVLTGQAFDDWPVAALLALAGLASVGISAIRLPGWARTREQQMEEVTERALLRGGTPDGGTRRA
jgi:hypothetical protein